MNMYDAFSKNKYTKWYINIIEKAKVRNHIKYRFDGYETHHIIPRSCGGSNDKQNLVCLTLKEHFIVHLLLLKMYQDNKKYKMYNAVHRMLVSGKYRYSSSTYKIAKTHHAIATSKQRSKKTDREKDISRENLKKACEVNRGRKYSTEHRTNISKALKGKKFEKNMPRGANHHMSKKITDGINIFISQSEAAEYYKITIQAISYRIKNKVGSWSIIHER